MKHILAVIALAFAALTLSAREVAKNSSTGMTLSENLGVYTITGQSGAIILGSAKDARRFFHKANKAFARETLNNIFSLGKDKYEVGKDDQGLYLIKVGLGACKIRPTDSLLFITAVEADIAADKAKRVIEVLKD